MLRHRVFLVSRPPVLKRLRKTFIGALTVITTDATTADAAQASVCILAAAAAAIGTVATTDGDLKNGKPR
jgi:hypothetical protein